MKTALISGGTIFALALALMVTFLLSAGRPCVEEDSTMCYWNGGSNGQGTTFVSVFDYTIPFNL